MKLPFQASDEQMMWQVQTAADAGAFAELVRRWEGPDESLASMERAEIMRRAVAGLPEHYRTVVVLRHYEGLKFAEIAEVLGIPEGTDDRGPPAGEEPEVPARFRNRHAGDLRSCTPECAGPADSVRRGSNRGGGGQVYVVEGAARGAGEVGSVMTLRVGRSDLEALSSGKLKPEEFGARVKVVNRLETAGDSDAGTKDSARPRGPGR